jgi:hypothetical protein
MTQPYQPQPQQGPPPGYIPPPPPGYTPPPPPAPPKKRGWLRFGILFGILWLAGCGAIINAMGGGDPVDTAAQPTPSATTQTPAASPAAVRYDSVAALRDAAFKAGYPCPNWKLHDESDSRRTPRNLAPAPTSTCWPFMPLLPMSPSKSTFIRASA